MLFFSYSRDSFRVAIQYRVTIPIGSLKLTISHWLNNMVLKGKTNTGRQTHTCLLGNNYNNVTHQVIPAALHNSRTKYL